MTGLANELLHILNEMSPFLLLGFLLAGLMHAFVPGTVYSRYLARPDFRSVLNATLFGIPLPLCSCGVIPTAMSLRREGASKGAATAFLIATPQTGVDSIVATWSLMGLPFALVRPLAALCTALFGGQMVNLFDKQDAAGTPTGQAQPGAARGSSPTFRERMADALQYAYIEMMGDIGKWLVIGLVAAALITVLVPDSFFHVFADNSLLSILLVLCIAIPMYVCATGSIPIAAALMLKGLTPGAGLVLLMAGPACNVASLLVVRKVLGFKTQCIYVGSIVLGAVIFGLGIDHLLPREWFVSSLASGGTMHMHGWFRWTCTAALCILLVYTLLIRPHLKGGHTHAHEHAHGHGNDTLSTTENTMKNERLFHIQGMNCSHCRLSAENALKSVPDVESAQVDLQSGEARVTGTASREALEKAIESCGFTLTD